MMGSPHDLLRQIQNDLITLADASPVLLKLRLLASRLGSDLLEEWVTHETEGYPTPIEVPEYRRTHVHYSGTFSNGVMLYSNVQIPPSVIEKLAGKTWVEHQIRQPLAEIEHLIQRRKVEGPEAQVMLSGSANLIPLLRDRVFSGMHCQGVAGLVPDNAFVTVQAVLRSRILDIMLKLEDYRPFGPRVRPI